jgi:predicted AAA+ superfamily ATPase
MIDVMKEIIVDNQSRVTATGVRRHLKVEAVLNKAVICIGVRRSGKSTFMSQIIEELISKGVKKENVVQVNFFDDRLYKIRETGFSPIIEAYYLLYPEKRGAEKVYFFFDEIQMFDNWEPFVDRLMRTENCEVYITGSSARMLASEIGSQMRGRSVSWELFPFSFLEFLDLKKIESFVMTSKSRVLIQNAFESYWKSGGFPEVAEVPDSLRLKIHQEYFNSILYRDLVDRHDIAHPKVIKDIAHFLIDNTGSLYSVNGVYGHLKSMGYSIQRQHIGDYIAWMEDCYFLFTVRLYDASLTRSNSNPKKIYCIDHAFVKSISSGILINSGHLLENLVFIALRRVINGIFYYRTCSGKEVDFITISEKKEKALFQVCENFAAEKTRNREILSLIEAMKEQDLKSGTVVTRNMSETIETDAGRIDIIPIWQFLLRR